MGPDGVAGIPPKIEEVSTGSGLRVILATPEEMHYGRFLQVELQRRYVEGGFRVNIHGGNTNDGTIEHYERAVSVYRDALKVARTIQRVMDDGDVMFEGCLDHDGDDILVPFVHGHPDYVLAAWLILRDQSFNYLRGYDRQDGDPEYVIGLSELRQRVIDLVRKGVTV